MSHIPESWQHFLRQHLGLLTLLLVFIFLCLVHPIYFMADDWERIYAQQTQNLPNFLRPYYLRFFMQGFCTEYIFPVFFLLPKFPLLMGKLLLWGALVAAVWPYLASFQLTFTGRGPDGLREMSLVELMKTRPCWGLIPIIIAFPPNNFEWNFFPTVMTLLPVLLVMSLTFYWSHRGPWTWTKVMINALGMLLGFYSYECLLPFALLMELTYFLYRQKSGTFSFQSLQHLLIFTLPPVFLCMILKYLSYRYHMAVTGHYQTYSAQWGFKTHLFTQMLNLIFSHDYYKTRWGTGLISLLAFALLFWGRWKTATKKDLLYKDALLLLGALVGTSYYYMIMNYSSRRALGAPLYFFWGLTFITMLKLGQSQQLSRLFRSALVTLFSASFFLHHGYLFREKLFERQVYQQAIASIEKKLPLNAPSPHSLLEVQLQDISGPFKRGWQLVNPIQLHGFLSYHLRAEDYRKILPFRKQFPDYRFIYEIK